MTSAISNNSLKTAIAEQLRAPKVDVDVLIATVTSDIFNDLGERRTVLSDPELLANLRQKVGDGDAVFVTACLCKGLFSWKAVQTDWSTVYMQNHAGPFLNGTANCNQFFCNALVISGLRTSSQVSALYAEGARELLASLSYQTATPEKQHILRTHVLRDNLQLSAERKDWADTAYLCAFQYASEFVAHYFLRRKDVVVELNGPEGSPVQVRTYRDVFRDALVEGRHRAGRLPLTTLTASLLPPAL